MDFLRRTTPGSPWQSFDQISQGAHNITPHGLQALGLFSNDNINGGLKSSSNHTLTQTLLAAGIPTGAIVNGAQVGGERNVGGGIDASSSNANSKTSLASVSGISPTADMIQLNAASKKQW